MHVPTTRSTKFLTMLAVFAGCATYPAVHAQGQSTLPPCVNSQAPTGAAPGILQGAQSVANAAKSLGALFTNKSPPMNSVAPTPCATGASGASATANAAPASPAAAATYAAANPAGGGAPPQGSAPWQPPAQATSVALPAPAGPIDPAKLPDVLGIHVGASRDVVPSILQKIHPKNQLRPEGSREPIFGMMFGGDLPEGGGENITVEYTMPPNKQLVYFITRSVTYKQPVSQENFIAALRQKYGREILASSLPPPTLYWAFDEQGNPMPASKNTSRDSAFGCSIPITPGGGWFRDQVSAYLHGQLPPASICDSLILLTVTVRAGPAPQPAVGADTTLLDVALLRRAVVASGEAAKAEQQTQQRQSLQNANQAKPNF
jgi:hypothetical protein